MSVENYHLLEIYSRDITKVFYVSTPISDMELTRPTRTSIVIEFDIKQGGTLYNYARRCIPFSKSKTNYWLDFIC